MARDHKAQPPDDRARSGQIQPIAPDGDAKPPGAPTPLPARVRAFAHALAAQSPDRRGPQTSRATGPGHGEVTTEGTPNREVSHVGHHRSAPRGTARSRRRRSRNPAPPHR